MSDFDRTHVFTPAAIVLTGGQSRRMGFDKASLVVEGSSLLEHVEQAVRLAGVSRVVVAGPHGLPDPKNPAGEQLGPLAGIVSGWKSLRSEGVPVDPVVVLAVDLPWLTTEVVGELISASLQSETGAVAHDGERPQPLIAAYRPAALDAMATAFADGERSVRRCFKEWDLIEVRFEPTVLSDADTPADLDGIDVVWPSRP